MTAATFASLIPTGIWTMLLVVGIAASFITVVMIVGTAPSKRQSGLPQLPPGSLAQAVRENASARAAAAVRNRPGHQLTNVRPVDAPIEGYLAGESPGQPAASPPASPASAESADAPAGQTATATHDEDSNGERAAAAEAIVRHFAINDPRRIAEVITAWIRADNNSTKRSSR